MSRKYEKNRPNWQPSLSDYLLVFREVDGIWREVSGNVPAYKDMILADYLAQIEIEVPDGCTFCRVSLADGQWEFRQNGGIIRVFYKDY